MEKHFIKQKILEFVCGELQQRERKHTSSVELAQILDFDVDIVYACCDEMGKVSHLNNRGTGSNERPYEFMILQHPIGKSFLQYGGYIKEFADDEEKKEAERLANEKLKIDLANARRVYKSYWITFILALAGFVMSVILIVLKSKGK